MPKSRSHSPHDATNTRSSFPERPWIHGGVDYGPAAVAVHELATWTFDVAELDMNGWPEGQRRVATARRFVRARINGRRARRVPYEDVVFTARLLARILDYDFALSTSEIVAVFDALGLPTEIVPVTPPRTPAARMRSTPTSPSGDLDPSIAPRLRCAA